MPPVVRSTPDAVPLVPVQVHGAPGHIRWGVVETPLPVKTQGVTMNCFFLTSAIKYCCRVAFNCRF